MDYNMFKEVILDGMREIFSEDTECSIHEVLKNNGVRLDGLVINTKENKVSPTIYLNDFYNSFLGGMEIEDILEEIERVFKDNQLDKSYDASDLMNFNESKKKIAYKLINYEMNKELLKDIPHRKYLDLAVVYFIVIRDQHIENATVLINNKWIEEWKITEEDLYNIARENSPQMFKAEIVNIKDMVISLLEEKTDDTTILPDVDCNMYVLTNQDKQYGAATILYENIISDFAKKNNSNIYILPSSIHELILVPGNSLVPKEGLNDMVKEVNATQVPIQEILSDHAYIYNIGDDSITFC